MDTIDKEKIKEAVRENYGNVAKAGGVSTGNSPTTSCCGPSDGSAETNAAASCCGPALSKVRIWDWVAATL
jgi:hypothetical protein